MTRRTVARERVPGGAEVRYRPLYARVLGLRHLHPGGMLCFAYLEGTVALSLLLALAELVSWWVVLILPVSVALMVKVNDLVAGAVARSAARTPERERERLRREVSAFMPVVGRATVVAHVQEERATVVAYGQEETEPADAGEDLSPDAGEVAEAGRRETAGGYAAAGRHLDAAWRQHAYVMAHHAGHTEQTSQRERQSATRRYE
jgi:predicted secreted protein